MKHWLLYFRRKRDNILKIPFEFDNMFLNDEHIVV
jgi:hypothetical protein